VVVVGGGTSGAAAAIASSRAGANTLLVERLGALGGQMNVFATARFAYAQMFNPRGEQVIGGIAEEIRNRLLKEGKASPQIKPDFRAGFTFSYVDADWWGLLIFKMMTESKVNLLLHSLAVDVVKQGNQVKGIVVENVSGRQMILSEVAIDCTGEGDIAVKAGAPYEMSPLKDLRQPSVSFMVDGIDWDVVLKAVREKPDDFVFRPHFDLNWTQEQVNERIQKVKDISDLGNIPAGWFSLEKKGECKPISSTQLMSPIVTVLMSEA
jgi:FAD dependent oxidoreductase